MKKTTLLFTFIFSFLVIIALFPITASADISGTGSQEDPFLIYTLEDLEAFRDDVNNGNNYSGKYIKLMNDIVMNGASFFTFDKNHKVNGVEEGVSPYLWESIGTFRNSFEGIFDGNNKMIKGLYIPSDSTGSGLFGYCRKAEIKNLILADGAIIQESSTVGALVSHAYDLSIITNCNNTCVVTGKNQVGGLIGYAYNTITISNCNNSGIVRAQSEVGGIVGEIHDDSTIKDCCNTGDISGTGSTIGGIVGGFWGSGELSRCYNTGSVEARSSAGGIIGSITGSCSVDESFNSGRVSATLYSAGGITSSTFGDDRISNCFNTGHISSEGSVGGIVGRLTGNDTIINCYNIGALSAKNNLGGIIGLIGLNSYQGTYSGTATVKDCFYISEYCIDGYSFAHAFPYELVIDNIQSLTASEMTDVNSFSGFDFGSVWTMKGTPDYPYPELLWIPVDSNTKNILISEKHRIVSYGSLKNSKDAKVSVDQNGKKITVQSPGYYTATIEQPKQDIYSLVPTSTNSHISAVYCNGFDALIDNYALSFPLNNVGSNDDKKLEITVYSDLDSQNIKVFQLLQNDIKYIQPLESLSVIAESKTGKFSISRGSIPAGKKLKVRVIDVSGKIYPSIQTSIQTYDLYDTSSTFKFKDDGKVEIAIPDSVVAPLSGMKFTVDLGQLPIFAIQSKDSIKIGIGASGKYDRLNGKKTIVEPLGTHSSENNYHYESLFQSWKKTVSDMKLNKYGSSTDLYKSDKLIVSKVMEKKKSVDFKVCGYCELSNQNGVWKQVGGEIVISLSAKWGKEWQTFAWSAPVVVSLSCSLKGEYTGSLGFDLTSKELYSKNVLSITLPEISGRAGVGIKIANAGVYAKLKNVFDIDFNNQYLTGRLSGEIGPYGKFLIFEKEAKLLHFDNWQYLHKSFAKKSSNKKLLAVDPSFSDFVLPDDTYDENSYSLSEREYLNNQSQWLGGSGQRMLLKSSSASSTSPNPKLLQQSIYTEANPQIASTENGNMLMFWLADVPERPTGNQTAVVYSLYNSVDDSWSEPQMLDDDGTADSNITVKSTGDNIYIAWVNSKTVFDETVTFNQFVSSSEICVSRFDMSTGSFDDPITITDNDTLDTLPKICADGTHVFIAFVNNANNAALTMEGINTIKIAQITDRSFETIITTEIDHPVYDFDISVINGEVVVAALIDTDNDISTSNDVEIYLTDLSGGIRRFTNNDVNETSIQFVTIDNKPSLAYYSEQGICYTSDFINDTIISQDDIQFVSPEFTFVNTAEGTVLFTKSSVDSETAVIYASSFENDKWFPICKVTNAENEIYTFSVCDDHSDGFHFAYTTIVRKPETVLSENSDEYSEVSFTEQVDMYTFRFACEADLELVSVSLPDETIIPGGKITASVIIKNSGMQTVDSFSVSTECLNQVRSTRYQNELKPGQTEEILFTFDIPSDLKKLSDAIFKVEYYDDLQPENNSQTVQIGYSALSLSIDKITSGLSTAAMATITNDSAFSTDAALKMFKNEYEGELVAEYLIYDIPAFESIVYYIDPDIIKENFDCEDAVCFEVFSCNAEKASGDNRMFFQMDSEENDEIPNVSFENVTAHNSGTAELLLVIDGSENLKTISLSDIAYDSSSLELIGGQWIDEDGNTAPFDIVNGFGTLSFPENYSAFGSVVKLIFKIKGGEVTGEYPITCSVTGTIMQDDNEVSINFGRADGTIKFNAILPGDVNSDGKVSSKDVTVLKRYLVGGWGVEINAANADVNGDGKVSSKDVTILKRYLVGGWGIVLG